MKYLTVKNLNNFGLLDKGYELYLRDFINNSELSKKYGTFYAPISETHGEDDANAITYSIDFKRFISQDECKYKRKNNDGHIDIIDLNKNDMKYVNKYYDMFKCMKKLKYEDFDKIHNRTYEYENDVERKEYENMVDRLLMKDKNIMLYLPKIIAHSNLYEIVNTFSELLKHMFKYRFDNVKKDLYFSFLYYIDDDIYFVITKYNGRKLEILDQIDTRCSEYFTKE